jgi:two-component system cell cycle sensor histidine kinase/response regulator CckA
MHRDWLHSNFIYALFSAFWIAIFSFKQLWMRRAQRIAQPDFLEYLAVAVLLVVGFFFRNFLGHHLDVLALVSLMLINLATVKTVIVLMRKQNSQQRDAEEALRKSEQKLSLHLQQTPLGVIECNLKNEVTEWNAAAEMVFGYAKNEVLGRNIVDLLVPVPARPRVQADADALVQGNGGTHRINANLTKDARIIMCEWFSTAVMSADGEVIGISSLCDDITEREHAAKEIENLAAFPRFNPNPVLQFSEIGSLIYFNESAQQMARSVGKNSIAEILPEDIVAIVRECLATGNDKIKRETKIEMRTIAWSFFPIAAQRSVHCYATDITDRLNLEVQLRQSTKMQSVGQLAAGVAHDFNNILTIIQGHSELISGKEKLTPPGSESLDQIRMAAERAAKLTQQLLTFGRKQFMQIELLDMNETIHRVTQMLRRVLGENVSLRCNLAPRLPMIEGDATMMEQIIMNLSVNARDAMPGGGSLIIGTVPVLVSRAYVAKNPEAREGTFICLSVCDNGTGIEPDKLDKLFEPFFTTKEVGKGTGLGLATVFGIVKQHQGWIEVESELGKGTTFKVFLPSSTKTVMAKNGKVAPQNVRGGRETVLLVEDEPGVLTLARGVLKSYGYDVLEARSGVEALRLWAMHDTRIDLLLTDIVMPEGMSGIDLAKKLRQEKHDLRVLYSSGYSIEVAGQDFGLRDGMAFLKKPYQPQALALKVRECLDAAGLIPA